MVSVVCCHVEHLFWSVVLTSVRLTCEMCLRQLVYTCTWKGVCDWIQVHLFLAITNPVSKNRYFITTRKSKNHADQTWCINHTRAIRSPNPYLNK